MPVRACECSWWVKSWEILCKSLSCLLQFQFVHGSGSVLFRTQLSMLWTGSWNHWPNPALEGACHWNVDHRSRQISTVVYIQKKILPLLLGEVYWLLRFPSLNLNGKGQYFLFKKLLFYLLLSEKNYADKWRKTGLFFLKCGKAWNLSQHTFSLCKAEGNSKYWPIPLLSANFHKGLLRLPFEIHACGWSLTVMLIFFA